MSDVRTLDALEAGMAIVFGGDRLTRVSAELAESFAPGDKLVVVQTTGDLLHIPSGVAAIAADAVGRARRAFGAMGTVSDAQIDAFYDAFAARLEDGASFAAIAAANAADVERAKSRGRSVTRLILSDKMRSDMVSGLRGWRDAKGGRDAVVETVDHAGWRVEQVRSGLGVVGFVFEGRPNVFADATGVLRSGNTVVFRIGSDALETAKAIVEHALDPAIEEAGLPAGAASLVASAERSAGHAMFSDTRLALAVARGSGAAVAQLGAVARQAGIPVSLHGTGGAWIVAGDAADSDAFASAVTNSLDRKVCNTLNTCCIAASAADRLVPVFLDALDSAAASRGATAKLWVESADTNRLPKEWFETVQIARAEGLCEEPKAEVIEDGALGREWEWEDSPEVTLKIVSGIDEAVALFNAQSPRFVASLISSDVEEHERFFATVDAPFVGNGFTRWVDGQYALDKPELGLSNWQGGRLFGRGGVLSGDGVYTVRTRVVQSDPDVGR